MDLREFIAQTLTQIYEGAEDAGKTIPGICPRVGKAINLAGQFTVRRLGPDTMEAFQFVDFDIAVTAEKKEGGKAGIGVASLGLGAGLDTQTSNQNISRIRFKVPLVLPADRGGG